MSPYRVLVRDQEGRHTVFAAMLSPDKKTGTRRIFIVEKIVPVWGQEPEVDIMESLRDIAHSMITKRNSSILAQYQIIKTEQLTKPYRVGRVSYRGIDYKVKGDWFLQSECLTAAMEDFCTKNSYELLYQF